MYNYVLHERSPMLSTRYSFLSFMQLPLMIYFILPSSIFTEYTRQSLSIFPNSEVNFSPGMRLDTEFSADQLKIYKCYVVVIKYYRSRDLKTIADYLTVRLQNVLTPQKKDTSYAIKCNLFCDRWSLQVFYGTILI